MKFIVFLVAKDNLNKPGFSHTKNSEVQSQQSLKKTAIGLSTYFFENKKRCVIFFHSSNISGTCCKILAILRISSYTD